MRAGDDLLHPGDHVFCRDLLCQDFGRKRKNFWWDVRYADVIDAFQQDDVRDTGLGQNIPVEACRRAGAETREIVQNTIAAYTQVEYGHTILLPLVQ